MLKLQQAISEGWTISGDPLAIVSVDPHRSNLQVRSAIFNEIMAGSAYHIQAFDIILNQDAYSIARVPDLKVGNFVKLTEPVTVQVQVEVPTDGEEVEPAAVHTEEVRKHAGTVARVVSASFGAAGHEFGLSFPDGSSILLDETSPQWFPFKKVDTFTVAGDGGVLTADAQTGAVLLADPVHAEITLIDVAELRATLGEVPDAVDLSLVGYTTKSGERRAANRRDYIEANLDDIDPVLAQFIKAQLKLAS